MIPQKQSWLEIKKKKVYHTCITLTKRFIDEFNKKENNAISIVKCRKKGLLLHLQRAMLTGIGKLKISLLA